MSEKLQAMKKELKKGERKFPYYRAKGDCSTCSCHPPTGDCTQEMFFRCCSSEYQSEPKIFRAVRVMSLFPDYYKPKDE